MTPDKKTSDTAETLDYLPPVKLDSARVRSDPAASASRYKVWYTIVYWHERACGGQGLGELQNAIERPLNEMAAAARKDERAQLIAAIRDWQGRTLVDFMGTEDLSELLDELESR